MSETASLPQKRLNSCFTVKNDKSKQIKSTFYQKTGSIPIIDQSINFICGYTDDQSKKIEYNLPLIVFGDHTRHVKYVNFGFAMGADGTQILKANDDIHDKYLYYVILRASELIGNYGYDRHFKHLKEFKTPLILSYEEQQKIASILENIDNNIDKTQEIIEKYGMMKQGLMQNLISNSDSNKRIVKIEEIILKIKRGPSLSANTDGKGVIYLTSDNINENNKLVLNEFKYLDNYYETDKCLIDYGDVIINCVNSEERVGKTAFFDIYTDNIIVGFNNFSVKFDSTVDSKYMYYYFSNDNFQKQIRRRIKPAINQVSFSGSDLTSLTIKIPQSKEEQNQISNVLTSIDEKIESEEKRVNKLQKIKTGLMQDLLTGKVRVKT